MVATGVTVVPPGYKRTGVGVIPQDWEIWAIGETTDCLDRYRVPLNESQRAQMSGPYPYCGANGVLDYLNSFVLDDDVILIAEDGGNFSEYRTRPIAYRMRGKIWVNNHAHVLKAKGGIVQDFIFYALVHKDILPYLAGGTRAKLNRGELNKIKYALPPLPEQRAIAEALSDVDGLLGSLEALIAKKRAIKKICRDEIPVRLLNYLDVYHKRFLRSDDLTQLVSAKPDQARRCAVEKGDVFFTPTSEVPDDIGRAAVVIENAPDGVYSYHLVRLRITVPWDLRFRAYVFASREFLDQASKASEGSGTRYVVTLPRFRALAVLHPSDPNEQAAIAAVLSDMDAEIDALERRAAKTRAIKQGMMQQLLTGRVRLVGSS
jgi:type I restriction enzyme S subunit